MRIKQYISHISTYFSGIRVICAAVSRLQIYAQNPPGTLDLFALGLGRMTDMQTAANNMKAQAWIGTSNNTHAAYIIYLGKL